MSSPNDVTAKVFDIVYENRVCERRTKGELDFVISKRNRGDAILDVGCGTGRHMVPLLKMGYKVVGIDNSKEMLQVLSEKLQANDLQADITCQDVLKAQQFNGGQSPYFQC